MPIESSYLGDGIYQQRIIGSISATEMEKVQLEGIEHLEKMGLEKSVVIMDVTEASLPSIDLNIAAVRRMFQRDIGLTIGYITVGASPGIHLFFKTMERVLNTPVHITDSQEEALKIAHQLLESHT